MTIAPHHTEVHRLVDRLTVPEVEALYVLLSHAVGDRDTRLAQEEGAAEKPHRLSFTGIASADPDFASSSAEDFTITLARRGGRNRWTGSARRRMRGRLGYRREVSSGEEAMTEGAGRAARPISAVVESSGLRGTTRTV